MENRIPKQPSLFRLLQLKQKEEQRLKEERLARRREHAREKREAEKEAAEKAKPPDPESAAGLILRLTAIRERLFWLAAVYANTLSQDVALEADAFRKLFRDIGERLKSLDAQAYEDLIAGHEALLLSEPAPVKHTIPLKLQESVEMLWEMQSLPKPKPTPTRPYSVPDGLNWML